MNPHQRAFLAAFRETGNVCLACKAAGVGRSSHYRWLEKDPEYRAASESDPSQIVTSTVQVSR